MAECPSNVEEAKPLRGLKASVSDFSPQVETELHQGQFSTKLAYDEAADCTKLVQGLP